MLESSPDSNVPIPLDSLFPDLVLHMGGLFFPIEEYIEDVQSMIDSILRGMTFRTRILYQ